MESDIKNIFSKKSSFIQLKNLDKSVQSVFNNVSNNRVYKLKDDIKKIVNINLVYSNTNDVLKKNIVNSTKNNTDEYEFSEYVNSDINNFSNLDNFDFSNLERLSFTDNDVAEKQKIELKELKKQNDINVNNVVHNIDILSKNYNDILEKNKPEEKKEETNEKKNKNDDYVYSNLLISASSVSVNSLNKSYTKINKNKCVKLNPYEATNKTLLDLCNSRPDIESLDISDCNMIYEFECIKKLKYLKEFSAKNCELFVDGNILKDCKNLKVLNLSVSGVTNIDFVSNFHDLQVLNCTACKIQDIKGASKCLQMLEVCIWGCIMVNDITPLENMQKLRFLDLELSGVEDLLPLINMKSLQFLFMDNCDKVKDFSVLPALDNLGILFADGNNIIMNSQLENFAYLKNLQILTLKNRKINSASVFSDLTKLKELILVGSSFSDVSPLNNLINLRKLDLEANSAIKDISSLDKLVELKKFLIGGSGGVKGLKGNNNLAASSNMEIANVDVIANYVNLEEFNTSNNLRIRDIENIKFCKKMEEVYLSKCINLENVSALAELENIQKIDLTSCPKIKDLYFLSKLKNLLELQFNGTIVYSPTLLNDFKNSNNIYLLKGNDSDMISKNFIYAGKKKCKAQKMFRKFFTTPED